MEGVFPVKQKLLYGKTIQMVCVAQSEGDFVKQEACVSDCIPGAAAGQSAVMQFSVVC